MNTDLIIYEYRDVDNNLFATVVRSIDKETGKKTFIPHTFQGGMLKRGLGELKSQPRPLYGLQKLKNNLDAPILLVEGEKTADAAQRLFPRYVVLSWLGGSGAAKKVDCAPLRDREIYLWPDNDEAGFKAMRDLADSLKFVTPHVYKVDISSLDIEKGWDLADRLPCPIEDIEALILDSTIDSATNDKDISNYPHMTTGKNPRPLDTLENVKHLLDCLNITVRWDMMSHTREILIPGMDFLYEERENATLNHIIDLAVLNDIPTKRIDKHLDAIAWKNPYHPVRNWILSKPLSDTNIFDKFANTLKTTNDDLSKILLKRWMLSAVYALFSETPFSAQGVLVIQGEPATHKSTFIANLAPQQLRAIKGGLSLDPTKKDDVLIASQFWIAELGELDATFRKADIARLKAFITNDVDTIRRPYAVKNSTIIRRTVFAATVNESRFLVDSTGNRRWWTISVTEPINTKHGLDMQQVWRCIYDMYIAGESPILNKNELTLVNELNTEFEMIDPIEDKISSCFDWHSDSRLWMSATDILARIGYEKSTHRECTRVGIILTNKNVVKKRSNRCFLYYMPRFRIN